MKLKELKRIAEENDYILTSSLGDFVLEKIDSENYISINGYSKNRIWVSNKAFCDEKDFNMIKAAVEFAGTPLDEREELKKYYLRHKWMGHEKLKYLELDKQNDEWYLGHKYDTIFCTAKNEFTLVEIEEIKEKYNTDLSDFEIIEVEE